MEAACSGAGITAQFLSNSLRESGGRIMIDYDEELKKFEPCLDVSEAESAIYDRELTDMLDILQDMVQESEKANRRRTR